MDGIYWALGVVVILFLLVIALKFISDGRSSPAPAPESEGLTNTSETGSGPVSHYTLYYTTWCPACKHMTPVWDSVVEGLKDSTDENRYRKKDITNDPDSGIERIPTILRHHTNGTTTRYPGGRDAERLRQFLSE